MLYDPDHHSKVVLDDNPGRYGLIQPGHAPALSTLADDPELAALAAFDAQPAPGSETDRLDQLRQIGELHASGVLTEAEFEAEKARVLGEG